MALASMFSHLYFDLFLLGAGALGSLYYWWRTLQQLRLIEDTPLSRCRSAAQGYVALAGTQKSVPDHPCVGPMTGKPCTWWRYTVENYRDDGKGKHWDTITDASSSLPFLIDDGTAEVMINPAGAKVTPSNMDRWRGDTNWPMHPPTMDMEAGDYRYTEMRMCDGDPLFASGQLGNHNVHQLPTNMDTTVSDILTAWKSDQTALLARFDTDGNGELDTSEWNKVREAAQAQAQATSNSAAPDVMQPAPMLSRPTDHRPFILSVKAEQDVAKDLRKHAMYGLLLFAGLTAVSLVFATMLFPK